MAIITAALAKGNRYSTAIGLPASKRQIQDAEWQARFDGSPDESMSFYMNSGYPDIDLPEMPGDRLDELNFFAHRLDSLSDDELTAFKALMTAHEGTDFDLKTLINMTYGLGDIEVSPASNAHMLGEFYVDNDLLPELEGVPESALPFIDREAVGNRVVERDGGMFIDESYVVIGSHEIPEIYDGEHLPEIPDNSDIWTLHTLSMDPEKGGTYQLPVDEDTLERIMENFSPEDVHDFTGQPDFLRPEMIKSAADLEALNKLAENLSAMSDEQSIVFRAAVQAENPQSMEALLDISEHTEEYELDRDASSFYDFGMDYLTVLLPEDFDPNILSKLGLTAFGVEAARQLGASLTDYGVISERGRSLSEVIYKEDVLPVIFDDREETEAPDQTDSSPDPEELQPESDPDNTEDMIEDGEETEAPDQTEPTPDVHQPENEPDKTEDMTEDGEDISDQPPDTEQDDDAEQSDDPEQALTDEPLEVVEILKQAALYTDRVIDDSEIPEGMYRYDLRRGDDNDFSALERKVLVDRAGSILTKEPIEFGDRDHIELDEDTAPNFSGEMMTVSEFAAMAVVAPQDDPVPDPLPEDVPDNAADAPVTDDEQPEQFADPVDEAPVFAPFPDDYPETYFTLDETGGGDDYLLDLPTDDPDDDDPALVDCDEDEDMGMGMGMT